MSRAMSGLSGTDSPKAVMHDRFTPDMFLLLPIRRRHWVLQARRPRHEFHIPTSSPHPLLH